MSASTPINVVSTYVPFGPSNFSNSTVNSYVNILATAGGAAVTAAITKAAATSVLARLSTTISNTGGGDNHRVGVNDGTTDWECGRARIDVANTQRTTFAFERLITGLGAGAFTFTARDRCSFGTAVFSTLASVTLTLVEVKNLNVVNFYSGLSNNFTNTTSTYVNFNYATGTPAQVSITKKAGTNLYVRAGASSGSVNVPSSAQLGVNVNSVDHDLPARLPWVSGYNQMLLGEGLITGLGAGTYPLTVRVKNAAAASASFLAASSAVFITVWEVLP